MRVLIGNMVKTGVADYPCASREEAEALYMTLHDRHEPERSQRIERELSKGQRKESRKSRR